MAATAADDYGWLGGKQRSTDALGGLTLMGIRLYNPATGRFLSVDPVPGGNPNTYTYPLDPINGYDLDGRIGCGFLKKACKAAGKVTTKAGSTTKAVAKGAAKVAIKMAKVSVKVSKVVVKPVKIVAKKAGPVGVALCIAGAGWAYHRSDGQGWTRVGDAAAGCVL